MSAPYIGTPEGIGGDEALRLWAEVLGVEQVGIDDVFVAGVPVLDLPTDRPRPPVRTTRAGREDHVLPADLVAQVKKTGAGLGASLFATLLAGRPSLVGQFQPRCHLPMHAVA